MALTTQEEARIAAIEARLAQLDGIGLSPGEQSTTSAQTAKIEGVKTTVDRVTLTIDSILQKVKSRLSAVEQQLQQHIGGN